MKTTRAKLQLFRNAFMAVLIAFVAVGLCAQDETDDEASKKDSRQMFAAFHCGQNNPAAVKAFAGCWKIGQMWDPPSDGSLTLGMRLSEGKTQLLIDSNDAQQTADSGIPRYCSSQDVFSVAPYPTEPSLTSSPKSTLVATTYVYVMLDIPNNEVKEFADKYYDSRKPKMTRAECQQIFVEFARKGGKYIRTFIVFGEDDIRWDPDGEEDFWAISADCKGWEGVEERLEKKLIPNP